MTTPRKIAANRRNAQRSTGPKTRDGKAASSRNALRHGALALVPIVPGLERADAWAVHRTGMLESLRPQGYLETVLAERVALVAWRLQRVARFEANTLATAQETAKADLASVRALQPGVDLLETHPDDAAVALQCAQETLGLLERLPNLPEEAPLTGDEAETILVALADAMAAEVDLDELTLPGVPNDIALENFQGWTAGLVRQGLAALAAREQVAPAALLKQARAAAAREVAAKRYRVRAAAAEVDRLRHDRLLPTDDTLAKVMRYEAHLERALYRTLHELQRLQAERAGRPGPPPLTVDITLSGEVDP